MLRALITEPSDHHDISEQAAIAEPVLNTEPTEPTEPTLSADPTDPMLNTDPWEATLNRDPSDHRDHFDSTTAHLRSKRTTIRRAGTPIIATDLARFLRGSTSGRLTTG